MEGLFEEVGIPRKYVRPTSRDDRFIALVHKNWLKTLLKQSKLPDFTEKRKSEIWPYTKDDLEESWSKIFVRVFKKRESKVIPLPCIRKNGQEEHPLLIPQLMEYVHQTNYKNLWKEASKKYSTSDVNKIKQVTLVDYNEVLREIIVRIYGCSIVNTYDGDLSVESVKGFETHQNIYPCLCGVETLNAIFLIHSPFLEHNLQDCVTFSPSILDKCYTKPLFLIYQILNALKALHERSLTLGEVTLSDIYLTEDLWVYIFPQLSSNIHVQEIPKSESQHDCRRHGHKFDSNLICLNCGIKSYDKIQIGNESLEKLCELWVNGQISNYTYLMSLNNLSGRRFGDPNCHYVFPWVTDFSSRCGKNWRDLKKSKYRLNKGDRQLDLTYENPQSQIPHHVSDVLSSITYYVYMSRRTPKSVLCKNVRTVWVPAEYPCSIQRLQEWTPDECIPEFFSDPTVFKSIHDDLDDLEVPSWCSGPEDFVEKHREALESQHVSERLHLWIDLTFGYRLAGHAAVRSKNVCLQLVDGHTNLTTSGVVQLFMHPHPPKAANLPFWGKIPPKIYVQTGKQKRDHSSSSTTISIESCSRSEEEDDDLASRSPLSKLHSRSRSSLNEDTKEKSNKSGQQRSTSLGPKNATFTSHITTKKTSVNLNTGIVTLPKEFQPAQALINLENLHNFFAKTFHTEEGKLYKSAKESALDNNEKDFRMIQNAFTNKIFESQIKTKATKSYTFPIDNQNILPFRTKSRVFSEKTKLENQVSCNYGEIIVARRVKELQVLGCLILEIFMAKQLRVLRPACMQNKFHSSFNKNQHFNSSMNKTNWSQQNVVCAKQNSNKNQCSSSSSKNSNYESKNISSGFVSDNRHQRSGFSSVNKLVANKHGNSENFKDESNHPDKNYETFEISEFPSCNKHEAITCSGNQAANPCDETTGLFSNDTETSSGFSSSTTMEKSSSSISSHKMGESAYSDLSYSSDKLGMSTVSNKTTSSGFSSERDKTSNAESSFKGIQDDESRNCSSIKPIDFSSTGIQTLNKSEDLVLSDKPYDFSSATLNSAQNISREEFVSKHQELLSNPQDLEEKELLLDNLSRKISTGLPSSLNETHDISCMELPCDNSTGLTKINIFSSDLHSPNSSKLVHSDFVPARISSSSKPENNSFNSYSNEPYDLSSKTLHSSTNKSHDSSTELHSCNSSSNKPYDFSCTGLPSSESCSNKPYDLSKTGLTSSNSSSKTPSLGFSSSALQNTNYSNKNQDYTGFSVPKQNYSNQRYSLSSHNSAKTYNFPSSSSSYCLNNQGSIASRMDYPQCFARIPACKFSSNQNRQSLIKRVKTCLTVLTSCSQEVPSCVRNIVNLLLQPENKNLDEFKYPAVTNLGLPPPTAHMLLEPLLHQLIPFNVNFLALYGLISNLKEFESVSEELEILYHFDCDGEKCLEYEDIERTKILLAQNISECKVRACARDLEDLFDDLSTVKDAEIIALLVPHIKKLIEEPPTSILAAWYLFDPVAKYLGPNKTSEFLLKPILRLYETDSNTAHFVKIVKLYHHSFLLRLIVRFGLKKFLEHFSTPLVEAVGGYRDQNFSVESFLHTHSRKNLVRKTSNLKNIDDVNNEKTDLSPGDDSSGSEKVQPAAKKAEREVGVFDFESEDNQNPEDRPLQSLIEHLELNITEDLPFNHSSAEEALDVVNLSLEQELGLSLNLDEVEASRSVSTGLTSPNIPIPCTFKQISCDVGSKKNDEASFGLGKSSGGKEDAFLNTPREFVRAKDIDKCSDCGSGKNQTSTNTCEFGSKRSEDKCLACGVKSGKSEDAHFSGIASTKSVPCEVGSKSSEITNEDILVGSKGKPRITCENCGANYEDILIESQSSIAPQSVEARCLSCKQRTLSCGNEICLSCTKIARQKSEEKPASSRKGPFTTQKSEEISRKISCFSSEHDCLNCKRDVLRYLGENSEVFVAPKIIENYEDSVRSKSDLNRRPVDDETKSSSSFSKLKRNEAKISSMAADSLIWLSHRLGPVLTARYLSRNLLKMLTLCYVGRENLVVHSVNSADASIDTLDLISIANSRVIGDKNAAKVLECLASIAALYGEQLILLQYLPHMSELIALCKRKLTPNLEGGLISCLALLKHIIPYICDSTLMDQLQDVILKNILHPSIRLLGSTKYAFPNGSMARNVLARKYLDTLYVLSLRMGADMTRTHLAVPALQRFFLIFDKISENSGYFSGANAIGSEQKTESQSKESLLKSMEESHFLEVRRDGTIAEWAIGGRPVQISHVRLKDSDSTDSLSPPKLPNSQNSAPVSGGEESAGNQALEELQAVFTPELAHAAYIPFLKQIGQQPLESSLKNHANIFNLCQEYEKELKQTITSINDQMNDLLEQQKTNSANSINTSSIGSNVALIGNRIDVQEDQDLKNTDILSYISNKMENNVRHLRGNWLAYWEHEIGRSDKDVMFNFKQIKLQTFTGHSQSIKSLHVLDNENSFLSGSRDKTVKLWSLRSLGDGTSVSNCQSTYASHKKSVLAIAFLDGLRLVASCDSVVHLWDPFMGASVGVLESSKNAPVNVLKSQRAPSSLLFAATTEGTLRVIDARICSYVHELKVTINPTVLIRCLAVSPSGNWIATGQASGQITVLDTRNGLVMASWRAHEGELLQIVAFNEDTIISSSLDQSISVWNVHDGNFKFHMKGSSEPVHCLNLYNNELISGSTANRIGVHTSIDRDASFSSTKLRSDAFKGLLTSMAVLPLNRLLLLGADTGNIHLLC